MTQGRVILSSPDSTDVNSEGRVQEGLQALYNFAEGSGSVVNDISETGERLDLQITNVLNTKWLPGQGLKFTGPASVQSDGIPLNLISALRTTNEVTIEAWVKSADINQSGPARIMSLSSGKLSRGITMGQVGTQAHYNYSMRLTTSETTGNGIPEVASSVNFTRPNLHHVVYARSSDGEEKLFVNNNLVYAGRRNGDFSNWEGDYIFLLGNETSYDRHWEGAFYLAAVYNRALTAEEVEQNFNSGFGEIRYSTKLGDLEPNKSYYVAPFVRTDEGNVYGTPQEVVLENVLHPPKDDSLYMGVYPNPSDGDFQLYLRKQDVVDTEGFIRIADLSGQVAYYKELTWPPGDVNLEIPLNLSAILPEGFYNMTLVMGDVAVARKLIIQQ